MGCNCSWNGSCGAEKSNVVVMVLLVVVVVVVVVVGGCGWWEEGMVVGRSEGSRARPMAIFRTLPLGCGTHGPSYGTCAALLVNK